MLHILITNFHERAAQGAWRSLVKSKYQVICATSKKERIHIDHKVNVLIHPDPNTNFENFRIWLEKQLALNKELRILPINEAILYACELIRSDNSHIRNRFIMPSSHSLNFSLSKFNASKIALKAGIEIPKTYYIKHSDSNHYEIPKEDLQFPFILKWDNSCSNNGVYHKGSLTIVNNKTELEDSIMELLPNNRSIILQSIVSGKGVGAFFLRQNGKILLRFAHRRLHEVPWTGGISAYCESSDDKEILEAGERLLEHIDYEGLAMVEFRQESNKPPIFLEINGRLWGSLGLAIAAGADFPKAMVEYHLFNQISVKQPDLKKKTRWFDIGLESLYLKSLKSVNSTLGQVTPIFQKELLSVISNFLNPFVHSNWFYFSEPLTSVQRYLRFFKREFIVLKRNSIKNKNDNKFNETNASVIKNTSSLLNRNTKLNKILFVCYGNICRSPFAEVLWKELRKNNLNLPETKSVGFHTRTDRKTPERFQSIARYLGIELKDHRSKLIQDELVMEADMLIAMDFRNIKDIANFYPHAIDKTILLGSLSNLAKPEIEDPYDQKIGSGGAVYRRIQLEVHCLAKLLIKNQSQK